MFDKIYQCSIADDDIHHQISSSGQFPDANVVIVTVLFAIEVQSSIPVHA
jgi:hypothetical protein